MVVFFTIWERGRPARPGATLAGIPVPQAAQLRVDLRRAAPARGPLVPGLDACGELRVLAVPVTGLSLAGGVAGGAGDLPAARMPLSPP
jgi:hypothetical protein